MDQKIVEMRAIVRGKVQGVFFRDATRRFARELELTGTVRNCNDLSVEIVAQGPKVQLEALLGRLEEEGPGSISFIERDFHDPTSTFDSFDII